MPTELTTDSPSPPILWLDNQVCFALYSTSLAMTKLYKPLLDAIGLTYPQYLVMLVLWEQDGPTVSELGERLFLDSGTLTPLLKRLASQGLVTRTRDADDERVVRIALTAAGRALRRRAVDVPRQMLCHMALDLPELARLRAQLTDLGDRLRGAASQEQVR